MADIIYAPIVVFAFNRPEALVNTIESLLLNSEASKSDLFVFVDGARDDKEGEFEKVEAVREYVKTIKGFKSVHYTFSETNKGLGNSVIAGVTKVVNQYGKVIVLEDDLVLSENFLSFMNQALDFYKNKLRVFSICGWSSDIHFPDGYQFDSYCCVRSSSWGWATWSDRWNSVDWKLNDWDTYRDKGKSFNQWGGSDCWKMLNDWKNGKNKSWAIRFVFAQFLQDKVSVFSRQCLVDNNGFDGSGTDCPRYCRTKWKFKKSSKKVFCFNEDVNIDTRIYHEIMKYRTIRARIRARLINILLENLPSKLSNYLIKNIGGK